MAQRERLTREARRDRLLDAAARIVVDEGAEAATMEAVAVAAGGSRSLAYAYFANRTELLVEVLEREVADFDRRSAARLVGATSFPDIVRAAVGAWFDLVEDRGPLLAALLQSSQLQEAVAERRDLMVAAAEGTYSGLAMALGVPAGRARAAATILLAGLGAALQGWAAGGGERVDHEETYIQIVLAALERLPTIGSDA